MSIYHLITLCQLDGAGGTSWPKATGELDLTCPTRMILTLVMRF